MIAWERRHLAGTKILNLAPVAVVPSFAATGNILTPNFDE
jgi:hypothetical protein